MLDSFVKKLDGKLVKINATGSLTAFVEFEDQFSLGIAREMK
jgi:hypothetical protein